jgi:hypothetical protein
MRQVMGILLILTGVAYIAFHGFSFSSREKVLDIGPLEASTTTHHEVMPYSPLLGGAIVAGGTILFIAGLNRRVS